MKKQFITEAARLQKLAGILKENNTTEDISYDDLVTIVNEILGDYGTPEFNLRPGSTVEKGVNEIKKYVEEYSKQTGKNKYDVYRNLYKDVIDDYIKSGQWLDAFDEDEELEAEAQLARDTGMFNAAALDMTYRDYLDEFGDAWNDAIKLGKQDNYFQSILNKK